MNRLLTLCAAALFFGFGAAVAHAATPILPVCSWPFEVTGQGITNVATPDTNATYWVMPLDLSRWRAMVIHGRYPDARFFNFTTYTATGVLVDTIFDAQIAPDAGSANPFAEPGPPMAGSYTVTIGANPGSGNFLNGGGSRFAFVVYRIYLPDQGRDRTGGVGVPAVSLTDFSGNSRTLRPCPFADAETSLGNLILLLEAAGMSDAARFLGQILALANQPPLGGCSPGQAGPAAVPFSTAVPGLDFFPNPQTTYFQTANLCFRPNQILVIRGKAPVFPNTYPLLRSAVPSFNRPSTARSSCAIGRCATMSGCFPTRLSPAKADAMTERDRGEFYTYVISTDPAPPSWPSGVTWLPWGPITFPITLIFRNILPENGFTPTGDYVPKGALCSQAQFTTNGWQGCFAEAGLSAEKR